MDLFGTPSVLIMMATYNGSEFIREQIESIINQDYTNWHLIIQDDNSKDKTIEVLSSYAQKDCRIEYRLSDQSGGANKNFHSLINYCKENTNYEFYIFADQDDVWHRNKLTCMLDYLNRDSRNKIPTLVYADMELIDGTGKKLEGTINAKTDNGFKNEISYFFSHNVYGCNMMMNQKLFKLPPNVDTALQEELILSHDNYYAKTAALMGEIYYIDMPLMNYRRHGGNVTAAQQYNYGINRILSRLKNINELAKDHAYTYDQTLVFIKKFIKSGISEEKKQYLSEIEKTIRRGGIPASFFILKHHVSWGNKVKTISHFGIFLLGLYKKYLQE